MVSMTVEDCRRGLERGLIPAVPVPFRKTGEMDAEAHRRYVSYMAKQPIAGVAVWAHTGRGLRLGREQRIEVLRAWAERLGRGKLIVAGVGGRPEDGNDFARYLSSAVDMGRDAREHGAHALLVHPPGRFRHAAESDQLTFEYHRQLASLGVPLILFHLYEAAGGMIYSPEVLRRLLLLPEVVGIKLATLDSVMTFQNVASLIVKEFPKKLLITGEDRFFGYSLMCGARAALVGMGAVCTGLQHELMRTHFERKTTKFLSLSAKVDRLSQVLFIPPMEGYIRRVMWALACLGILPTESTHDPWGPNLPENEFERLELVLGELGQIPARRRQRVQTV